MPLLSSSSPHHASPLRSSLPRASVLPPHLSSGHRSAPLLDQEGTQQCFAGTRILALGRRGRSGQRGGQSQRSKGNGRRAGANQDGTSQAPRRRSATAAALQTCACSCPVRSLAAPAARSPGRQIAWRDRRMLMRATKEDKTAIRGGAPVACAMSELGPPDSTHVSTLALGSSTDKATHECARTALHLTVAALR